jgi:O-methyltransferase involved in polyketide biosynthesis
VAPLATTILHRQVFFDAMVRREGARGLLELACGLSRRGAVLVGEGVEVVEVDLPAMMAARRGLLERSEVGRAVLCRPNLRLVEADLATAELTGLLPAGDPAVVIAEGLFMYLDAAAQRSLWRRVRGALAERGGLFLFDLVPAPEQPLPGRVGRALGWLMERFTGGRGFQRDTRTRSDIVAELTGDGFDVEVVEPFQVAHEWGLPRPAVRSLMVVFLCRVKAG